MEIRIVYFDNHTDYIRGEYLGYMLGLLMLKDVVHSTHVIYIFNSRFVT
jgi:hypothetical protein